MARALVPLAVWLLVGAIGGCVGSTSGPGITATDGGGGGGGDSTFLPLPDGIVDPTVDDQAKFEQLVSFTKGKLGATVPGAAIAVLLPGKPPLLRGVGVKRSGGGAPVTPETLFSLASVSKMITAATILKMAEDHRLSLADPVVKHLPTFNASPPNLGKQMTIGQLLAHTSGLGYLDDSAWSNAPLDWTSPNYVVQIFEMATWPIWCAPGKVHNYSNPGYGLAGVMIKRAGNLSYAQQVKQTILSPTGMTRSTVLATEVITGDYAHGHSNGKSIKPSDISTPFDDPANGVYSSARDMAAFVGMLLAQGKGVLSPASVTAMTSSHADLSYIGAGKGYGYGWFVSTYNGNLVLHHGGSNSGFTSSVQMVPGKGVAAIALMNSGEGDPGEVTDRALELFAGVSFKSVNDPPPTAADLQKLAGTYFDPFTLKTVTIATSGGGLSATFTKWGVTSALSQYGQRLYYATIGGQMSQDLEGSSELDIAFHLDSSGQKGEYIVTLYGVALRQP